jgi:hypothetical protein
VIPPRDPAEIAVHTAMAEAAVGILRDIELAVSRDEPQASPDEKRARVASAVLIWCARNHK